VAVIATEAWLPKGLWVSPPSPWEMGRRAAFLTWLMRGEVWSRTTGLVGGALQAVAGLEPASTSAGSEVTFFRIGRPVLEHFEGRPQGTEIHMKSFASKVQRFLVSEDGPTAVEYAVMLALIVIVCLTAIQSIGTAANGTFTSVAGALPAAS